MKKSNSLGDFEQLVMLALVRIGQGAYGMIVRREIEERTGRVDKLKDIMEQSNVNVAEKFRKVMEAYQIENDYGSSSEFYTQTISLDGAPRSFNILRIGRIGLYFQSDDTAMTGRWDNTDRQWVIDNSIRNEVRKGLRMARQLIAPELIIVPVAAPTPAEAS